MIFQSNRVLPETVYVSGKRDSEPRDNGDASCGSRAFHEHKNFAVPYVILCEKLRSRLRIDSYGGVWVACLNRAHGLTFVRNGNKGPFLQWRGTTGVR